MNSIQVLPMSITDPTTHHPHSRLHCLSNVAVIPCRDLMINEFSIFNWSLDVSFDPFHQMCQILEIVPPVESGSTWVT